MSPSAIPSTLEAHHKHGRVAMNHEHVGNEHFTQKRAYRWAVWCLVLLGGAFLIAGHRAHLLGALPYALLLACPLMHMFMHRHHGQRRDHGEPAKAADVRVGGDGPGN